MAPAGSYESLMAAINAGCDAVYFGVAQLNMRARSANFEFEDLKKVADICREYGVLSYLTVNTILYDHDLKMAYKIIDAAKEAGISAIIASDIAAINYARSISVEVNISTQLSVSNIEGVKFWSKYADIIVLARELDLKMVKNICDEIKSQDIRGPSGNLVQIECFIHGAMCIAVSGRCGMSLYTENSSANRGACKQNCRKAYKVIDKESGNELEIDNEFVMSPSDMCTIEFFDRLVDAGISVFKIEGRGRSPDYVDMVVSSYNEALNSVINGSFSIERAKELKEKMCSVYNRGFSSGYYLGLKQEWSKSDGSKAKEEKVFAGKIAKYFPKAEVIELDLTASDISVGDEFVVTGPVTGVARGKVCELRLDSGENVENANNPKKVTIKFDQRVRRDDRLYKLKAKIDAGENKS